MHSQEIYDKCLKIAEQIHDGQFRTRGDDDGKPYIIHPKRICSRLPERSTIACAALLHDVIEDSRGMDKQITESDLISMGIPRNIVSLVVCLTKKPDENYFDFVDRVCQYSREAALLKAEDIKDNMDGLSEGSLKDKYRFALDYIKNHEDVQNE